LLRTFGEKISPFSDNWVVSIMFMHRMTNAGTIIELAIQREIKQTANCSKTFTSNEIQTSTYVHS
jgi:hypothetical protein